MLAVLRNAAPCAALPRCLLSTSISSAAATTDQQSWAIRQEAGPHEEDVLDVRLRKDDVGVAAIDVQRINRASPGRHHLNAPPPSTISFKSRVASQFEATFFPVGFPASTAPGYLKFAAWQAAHHAAGSANGVLASTFLLYAVGLGAGAIPTAGALSWVLKDGIGQVGTLLFGRAVAHNFDVASRGWYVAASAKLNLAMGLEIATALAPAFFLPIGAAANACKGLAWMSGGSARSAFNVAFAADHNIADITAKATSQTICTTLIGSGVGMAIAAAVEQAVWPALGAYAALAAVHMWTSVESARCVPLATLNPSRLTMLAEAAVRAALPITNSSSKGAALPTPAQLADKDGVLQWEGSGLVKVGTPLGELVAGRQAAAAALLPLYRIRRHLLLPDAAGKLHLVLHEDGNTEDAVLGVLQAAAWMEMSDSAGLAAADEGALVETAGAALRTAQGLLPSVMSALSAAGWETRGVVLEPRRRRAVW